MKRRPPLGPFGTARSAPLALSLLSALFASCSSPGPEPPPSEAPDDEPEVREILLDGAPAERPEAAILQPVRGGLTDALARLASVARDPEARGLLLRVGPMGSAWGRVEELRTSLRAVREADKPVHCHFENTDNLGYAMMAESCDRISMTPAGDLNLVGVSAHLFFLRGLLDRIGVRFDFLQVGRFKGAADPFVHESMPEAVGTATNDLLDALSNELLSVVAAGRSLNREEVQSIVDGGPYGSATALENRLIDGIAFLDEARERVRDATEVKRVRRVRLRNQPEPSGLLDLLEVLTAEPPSGPPEGERLALVVVEGTIIDSEEPSPGNAPSGPFVESMRRLRNDDGVKAVVVRISSPGGSALASDRMWHALWQLAKQKPVIVSVGDLAASGGYYLASAADEIVAHSTSLVGSIGVVGGKVTVDELASEAGVSFEVLTRGARAAWTSPTRPFTDEEREVVRGMMEQTYDRFLRRIMRGRDMDRDSVQRGAEGRIWTGRQAIELGLVDREGGLEAAMERARELGSLNKDAPVERWPRELSPVEALQQAFGGGPTAHRPGWLTQLASAVGPEGTLALPALLLEERTALIAPYTLEIR